MAVVSADGRYVAFASEASNLVRGDTNNEPGISGSGMDIFLFDRKKRHMVRVTDGYETFRIEAQLSLSADGRYVAFVMSEKGFLPGEWGQSDIYLMGPLDTASEPPYTLADAGEALRAVGGLSDTTGETLPRLNADLSPELGLPDAILIARKVAGLEPNP